MSRLLRAHLPLVDVLSEAWHRLLARRVGRYRPERHYMRGPGPKWQARQQD